MTTASTLRRFASAPVTGNGVAISALHPAHRSGRTIFPSRVFDPSEVQRVLKTGHQQRKIGKTVQKGPRRGWPIFTLTLEERATCPRTCAAWSFCYGNGMQAAERIVAGAELEEALNRPAASLGARHLHALRPFDALDRVSEALMAGRSLDLGTVLRMHAAYRTPLSMREVARRFGIGKTAVARAFRDWNLPAHRLGGIEGQDRAKPVRRPSAPIVFRAPALKRFCDQCERRVSAPEAARCRSRFCKAITPSQRQGLAQQQGARWWPRAALPPTNCAC